MSIEDKFAEAIEKGKQKAAEVLAVRQTARERRSSALAANAKTMSLHVQIASPGAAESTAVVQTAGFLAAVGDSWFDYPLHDVLKILEDNYGYNIESTAHKGDAIEKMAYAGGQLEDFGRKLDRIKARGVVPKAFLVSGGGDDVAGNEFGMLINNFFSPIAGWNNDVVNAVLDERIATAYVSLLSSMTRLGQATFDVMVPILVHGYDYPVPDGRGFLGGWPFPGPWLEPGFREKNFADLVQRVSMMHDMIDWFNDEMLQSVVKRPEFAHVHYIDLRKTLSTDLTDSNYQLWWANELHPTDQGFDAVTKKFADFLQSLS